MKLVLEKENCSGCTACMNICPNAAITMKADEKGFLYPEIDSQRCTECGMCRRVCSFQDENLTEPSLSEPHAFAVKHRKDDVRMKSSSGGMFTAVSDWILQQGGVVYGAAYDDAFRVHHIRAMTKEERDAFRGSKYVQSSLETVFRDVKADLNAGLPVLFTGTPCQVAGLKNFLALRKTNTENLYLCDIVCHGAASPAIFQNYLNGLRKKYGSEIKTMTFRDKQAGWRSPLITVQFWSGREYRAPLTDNDYYQLFGKNIILRPSCSRCPFANLHRPSDITIGDFWGIENSMPEFEDEKGVSLVLTNSDKGNILFKAVRDELDFRDCNLKNCLQPNLRAPSTPSPKSDAFWEDYQRYGFEYVARKYAVAGIRKKAKKQVKRVLCFFGLFGAAKKGLYLIHNG
jgi:coenzyme F420-reducing hydrogenase beta subunit